MSNSFFMRTVLIDMIVELKQPQRIVTLSKKFGVHPRSIYRYIKLFNQYGFVVESETHGIFGDKTYQIKKWPEKLVNAMPINQFLK